MAAKPLSLADRIRAKKKANRPESEVNSEKELISKITSISTSKTEKAHKPTAEQTPEQLDNTTSKQLSRQLPGQENNPTHEQTDNSTSGQTVEQLDKSTTEQLSEQADKSTTEQTTEQLDNWTREQTPKQVNRSTSEQPLLKSSFDQKPSNLKHNQYRVLKHIYFNRPFRISGPEGLWKILDIKYGTVRQNLRSLANKGYIEPHYSINDGIRRGATCRVIESKCLPLFGPCPIPNPTRQVNRWTSEQTPGHVNNTTSKQTIEQIDNWTSEQTSKQVNRSTIEQTPEQVNSSAIGQVDNHYNSSSSLLNKTTTNTLESHPELGYWLQKGLKQKQIATWAQEFQISEEDVIESLCFCRFDMIDNDRENKDQIKDVFAWFYKIVKRAGAYPKPNNYKSHHDKMIERERRRTEERKKQAEELRKARQEAVKAQYELEFEQMLQDPDDPIHQKCRETLPALLKKPNKAGSIAFVAAMKNAFCKLNDIEDC